MIKSLNILGALCIIDHADIAINQNTCIEFGKLIVQKYSYAIITY